LDQSFVNVQYTVNSILNIEFLEISNITMGVRMTVYMDILMNVLMDYTLGLK
jgi:hypothetical protein